MDAKGTQINNTEWDNNNDDEKKVNIDNSNNQDMLAALNIQMVDQNALEKQIATDADKAILDKELEIENKRLAKANDKYLKYKGKLLSLQKKLNNSNLKISEKTRLSVQIEELEENEIMESLHDVEEVKSRVRDIRMKMNPTNLEKTFNESSEPHQLPDETREEYLIRTGKITAFGTSTAFIEEKTNLKAPTHKNLIMPGFDNIATAADSKEFIEVNDNEDDIDFKIDYDEINSENVTDDSEDIDFIDEDDEKLTENKSKRFSKSATKYTFEDGAESVDDGDEYSYQKRLNKWQNDRSKLRKKHRPEYYDDPDSPEWFKPHPTVNDAILNDHFKLPGDIFPSLFDYQKTCVQWLSELHLQKTGGIIGDEMGLGKTVQMISFLAGLHYSKNLKGPILVVCPATVLKQWCNEFHRWWPPFRAIILHSIGEGLSKKRKTRKMDDFDDFDDFDDLDDLNDNLENEKYSSVYTLGKTKENKKVQALIEKVINDGHVIITTYAGVRIYAKYLLPVKWGYVILDEGHKIRNPDSYITITCKQLKTPNRIILSGTPIQNNLIELWSLFDFVFPGRLGTLPVFQRQFCIPINLGGYANATNVQVQTGYKCAVILKDLVSPYLLRRVKADVAKDLPKKTEMVLFCKLTPEQRRLYKKFIDSADLRKILQGKRNALYGIDMLRKICNHPNLVDLSLKDKKTTKLPTVEELSSKSGKIQVVLALLDLWTKEKRKTLIFTQTKQMLNILQQLLDSVNMENKNKYIYMRMDGSTPVIRRQELVDQFNKDPKYKVFLLTTRVGGLGVNLTGASRVIIYDPDWNPSTDMQARERAWRLGQKQDVAIYRLIMASAIEEKIYHRQIFKQFLTNKILKDPKQKRFFKMTDMYDLFTLGDDEVKGTETADLFGANETTFDGIKERKTKFKSRPLTSNNLDSTVEVIEDGDADFINATKIAAVAGLEEYKEENVKEKSMFDDDDSRVHQEDNTNNSRIMSEIFKQSGIHSAVEHESIIEKSNHSTTASATSAMLVDNEATRIANEAIEALKKSRKLTKASGINVPTWTGKFGKAGRINNSNKRPRIYLSTEKDNITNSTSSSSILANLKRKQKVDRKPVSKSQDLITQLSNYMSNVEGNFSKSADILDNLNIDFSDKKTVDIVRKMLKGICIWDKERKVWVLKPEFQ
jgi:DNA excision repair protein ERCC-6